MMLVLSYDDDDDDGGDDDDDGGDDGGGDGSSGGVDGGGVYVDDYVTGETVSVVLDLLTFSHDDDDDGGVDGDDGDGGGDGSGGVDSGSDGDGVYVDDYVTGETVSVVLDLLTFFVEHHSYHCKNFVVNRNVGRHVLTLLKSRHAFVSLGQFVCLSLSVCVSVCLSCSVSIHWSVVLFSMQNSCICC